MFLYVIKWLITSGLLIGAVVALFTPIVWCIAILLAIVGLIRDLSK